MELRAPFVITSRLLAGVRLPDANEISIEFGRETSDGRIRYKYYIDTPDFSYENDDLKSGVGGGSLQQGMLSLLSFLGAAAEAFRHGPESDNFDLFPKHVMEWAYQNANEISMIQMEIQEGGELISENPEIDDSPRGYNPPNEISPAYRVFGYGRPGRIHAGMTVIVAGSGKRGRVVMPSSEPGFWVLNMGGRHGTPAVVHEDNIITRGD